MEQGGDVAHSLRDLLARYRASAATEREKGTYFERLVATWMRSAPTQRDLYSRVLTFAEWAKERGEDATDTGIDLVAQLADAPDAWCAVQCKFYKEGHRLRMEDISGFFAASGRMPFVRRVFVDTTGVNWTDNAEATLHDQQMETLRISLTDLEDSGIDWGAYADTGKVRLHDKKQPRQHQRDAIDCVREGLAKADRGKLIMACGTGKTFTALKIAEELAGKGGRVLFLVPSLALMQQTVREWSIDSGVPLRSFAVCSDAQVGVRRGRADDLADIDVHDLEIPATTDGSRLAAKATATDSERMTVVFSTYQSIPAISVAQKRFGLPEFDIIVCDEAHRTTGVTLAGEDESNFVRVHEQDYIAGRKRLYMTATPRVYGEALQQVARDADAALCSMDDPALFGETLFTRNFGWAVQNGLLTDYKVIVLAVNEADVSASLQARLADENSELLLDDATKIVGCYKALLKSDFAPDAGGDSTPMRRAIAFAKSIAASKLVEAEFSRVASDWRAAVEAEADGDALPALECRVKHVDGGFNAKARDQLLSWVKEDTGRADECRILTNARCLSEGVDIPALDAIMFLHPRKSQIDVVQAVGRVMRRAEGKRMGYVILPVGVPAGVEPEDALDDNERYRVVWQILNALRSHDERLDATINKIDLGVDPGDRIEVVAVTNHLPERAEPKVKGIGIGQGGGAGDHEPGDEPRQPSRVAGGEQGSFAFDEFSRAILARIVKKCGTRTYWEDWARDVARIAEIHVTRIKAAVEAAGSEEKAAFDRFLAEIRDDLNDSITAEEAMEMLAQHLITRPVFEALFEGYSFAASNPVSRALEGVLDVLDRQHLEKEAQGLGRFYDSVRSRAAGIEDAAGKQKIVLELYDKFFRTAFPKMAERLGIVYTPVEVVDFILRSVDELLRENFGETLSSKGVHVIDPFVGTGTFITRLLQLGLIRPEDLERKYRSELHASEIVLLAYYIAAINIEAVYHAAAGGEYVPFEGICLTDTFQLYEGERDLVSELMADNTTRRVRQKRLPIRVIVGNPPYSEGQKSENDNADNLSYPVLDGRIRSTYAARSRAKLAKGLYNSYVRALRWASDRMGPAGVVGFVTNAGWVDANMADGLRKSLADEFSSIYVFHLRGNQRTSGELSRREGGKIFGQGSRAPIAITILVKNPEASEQGVIHFHNVGDYLSREEKLAKVRSLGSVGGLEATTSWQRILPDVHGDWLGQRDAGFDRFISMGDKSGKGAALFERFSLGVVTNRDFWARNPSRAALAANMAAMIGTYNAELERFNAAYPASDRRARENAVDRFVDSDPKRISWTRSLKADLVRAKRLDFDAGALVRSLYRPFSTYWLYYDRRLNEMVYQMPRVFPMRDALKVNRAICIAAPGHIGGFSALMTDVPPELCVAAMKGGTQCFPRWLYDAEVSAGADGELGLAGTASPEDGMGRRDAITDTGLEHFRASYPGDAVSKDDVFHYVYGMLHSPEYRARFADNLTKQLPRIPTVGSASAFRAFVSAGRELADLHACYEQAEPYPVTIEQGALELAHVSDPAKFFRVEKMRFGGKRPKLDRATIIYNPNITITDVPLAAYDYIVNGKPAIEWVMERQGIKTDPASGIVWDTNSFANETMGNPAYPFELLCRVITVSLRTMEIVRSLPPLYIEQDNDIGAAPDPAGEERVPAEVPGMADAAE
ncbi:damage-inducible protein [Roseomonas nepalensis]|uniref:Damage-inducible protein n=2 Tax=Muricoccus nepalensis TaxID=1854500 RepID=A0A502FU53_9PROT|nr:damage-inducible protein [Roseomonas nepalensis]